MLAWYKEQDRRVYDPQRPELKTYTSRVLPQAWAAQDEEQGELPALERHPGANGTSPK